MNYLLNRLTAMKKLYLLPLFFMSVVLNATDYNWAGLPTDTGNLNWSDFSNWDPIGAPAGSDNVYFNDFTVAVGSGKSYNIQGLTEVNDLTIKNLVIPDPFRFFIYTTGDNPTINGNVYIGNINIDTGAGGEWRSPNIRGQDANMVIKGSIYIKADSTTTQVNASQLTFGGTNTSGFFKSLSIGKNAAVDVSTGYKTAVYLDASYAGATLELAGANPAGDTSNWAVIHGVVKMNNSADGSKYASLLIGRNEEVKEGEGEF